tara:strand:- start:491 stop:679 length:189 start_codon:yes stop_codon:yes gene_type:complete
MEIIRIRKNQYKEYEVPAPTPKSIYYTDDLADAIATAKMMHGDGPTDPTIQVKVRHGSYTSD